MEELELINAIKLFYETYQKTPTIQVFAELYNTHASSIVRKFGSWNILLKKAGLKPNKSDKRTIEQVVAWIKAHPNARYHEIPFGIRNRLEEKYGTISAARKAAGLIITDWRHSTKRHKYSKPILAGRPIEYTEEIIVEGLRSLAIKYGRPPRIKDITKKQCGFTISAVLARYGTLNAALLASSLPTSYTHQEQNRLFRELEIIMVNVKIALNDLPLFYNIEINGNKPTFIYNDRYEYLFLRRSEICGLANNKNIVTWFLIDDSLEEIENVTSICVMDLVKQLDSKNPILSKKIIFLRKKFDEMSRKYVGQPMLIKKELNV